jgi:hypothetical protein
MLNIRMVNSLAVETFYGFKDFYLMCGDICDQPADLLVFSTHTGKSLPTGGVLTALRNKYGWLDLDSKKAILDLSDGSYFDLGAAHPKDPNYRVPSGTWLLEPTAGMPYKEILLVFLPAPHYFPSLDEALKSYRRAVECVFSSIAALEFQGKQYNSLSFSLLGGARSYPRLESMSSLISNAVRWLNYSKHTYKVFFTVYEESEVSGWSEAMNRSLGRTFSDGSYETSIKELRGSLKERIGVAESEFVDAGLKTILHEIAEGLGGKSELSIQQFGMLGRKLAESVSSLLCADLGIKPSTNTFSNIERIAECKQVSKWIHSYLHNLRVLGNEAVHIIDREERVPEALSSGDLLVILSNVLRVIDFYSLWLKRRGVFLHKTVNGEA